MSLMNRSGLNSVRSSIGMGQGNIRNAGTRNKDMASTYNSMHGTMGNTNWKNPGGLQVSPQEMGSLDNPSYGTSRGPTQVADGRGAGDFAFQQPMPQFMPPQSYGRQDPSQYSWGGAGSAPPVQGGSTRRGSPWGEYAGYDPSNRQRSATPTQDIADPLPVDYATSYVPPNFAGGY